jgi:hypothetical protein
MDSWAEKMGTDYSSVAFWLSDLFHACPPFSRFYENTVNSDKKFIWIHAFRLIFIINYLIA